MMLYLLWMSKEMTKLCTADTKLRRFFKAEKTIHSVTVS